MKNKKIYSDKELAFLFAAYIRKESFRIIEEKDLITKHEEEIKLARVSERNRIIGAINLVGKFEPSAELQKRLER